MWEEIDKTPLLRIKINFFFYYSWYKIRNNSWEEEGKSTTRCFLTPHNGRHPVESDATSRLTSETSDKHCRGGNVGNRTALFLEEGGWVIAGQKRHTHSHCPDLKIDRDPYQGPAGGKSGVHVLFGENTPWLYLFFLFFIFCIILSFLWVLLLWPTIIIIAHTCCVNKPELAVLQRAANALHDEKIDLHH